MLFAVVLMSVGAASARTRPAVATHQVVMDGTAFTPATLHVNVGDRVIWINRDLFPHTATSRERGFDSRKIAPGKSWTYRTTKKGQFPYLCTLHPTMKGTLRVE
jgi:plastocyanin